MLGAVYMYLSWNGTGSSKMVHVVVVVPTNTEYRIMMLSKSKNRRIKKISIRMSVRTYFVRHRLVVVLEVFFDDESIDRHSLILIWSVEERPNRCIAQE